MSWPKIPKYVVITDIYAKIIFKNEVCMLSALKMQINPSSSSYSIWIKTHIGFYLLLISVISFLFINTGCTAARYRMDADKTAQNIIREKQEQLFGKATGLNIERPSDMLRRRLMIEQALPHTSNASLGTDKLEKIAHWPEDDYPSGGTSSGDGITVESGKPLKLSLIQALQIAAMNSSEYQSQTENVFQKALDLNLRRHEYGLTIGGDAG